MSEYQCYEFVALDRPLSAKQMAELRAISTRAEISPTRFWNEYHWGDLKADPAKLVERYFDAHLYFANWGSHRLMLRLPKAGVDAKALKPYFVGRNAARIKSSSAHVILDIHGGGEEPEDDEESQGSLAALAPLRAELIRGDLRPAYLAWLLAAQADDIDGITRFHGSAAPGSIVSAVIEEVADDYDFVARMTGVHEASAPILPIARAGRSLPVMAAATTASYGR